MLDHNRKPDERQSASSHPRQTPANEPFIKDRATWRTFDLPPGAPPRRGLLGFIKYLIVVGR